MSEDPDDGDEPDDGGSAGTERRHDRLGRHPTPGVRNSLWHWTDAKPVTRVALNYVLVLIARVVPSLRLRNWALRRLGVTLGTGVSWGLEATPDVFWPELITLGDHAVVGYDSVLLCHEFLQDEYRTGEVAVGERAMIGAKAVILPGVRIGENAQVAANSLVTRDVPPGTTVAGIPAEPVDRDGNTADGGTSEARAESVNEVGVDAASDEGDETAD
ncbi:MAG: DapH/DapD/GlmU-related protein [Halobellus sp.]|uniref:acyltransferase n=1 Tax=Halobellus sp. TaxID=1979212 RepID=UPI0035D3F957